MHPGSLNSGKFPNRTVHLLGRRLTLMTVPAIVQSISDAAAQNRQITIGHYNVHGFNLSMQLPWFHSFLQSTDITHCDGMGIIKALSFLGMELPKQYRVSYTLLMPALLRECDRKGLKMFLLGAKPEHLETALANLRAQYPNAEFVGQHGYFPRHDLQANGQVIEAINQAKPDVLLVGMGMPIQEEWVLQHRHQLDVNAILVGGAIIDRMAGEVSDCPTFLSNLGLEWGYRLAKEPRRLGARYLLGNPAFVCQILLAKLLGLNDALASGDDMAVQAASQALAQTVIGPQKRLGEYLVEAGLLTPQHIRQALAEQRHSGLRLGEILVSQGRLQEATVEFIMAHSGLQNNVGAKSLSLAGVGVGSARGEAIATGPVIQTAQSLPTPKRLGEYLIEAGLSTPQHINQALDKQRNSGLRLGEILVDQGEIRSETVEFLVSYLPTQSSVGSLASSQAGEH